MTKLVNLNGQIIEARVFAKNETAQKFINKVSGRKMIFVKAGQYWVSKNSL